jgi:hypothetical protein
MMKGSGWEMAGKGRAIFWLFDLFLIKWQVARGVAMNELDQL